MTHSCIVVKRTDEKRQILLHTYHSGYLIPDIVKAVPAFICKHRWSFMIRHHRRYPTEKVLRTALLNSFDDGMYYQPSVAALLVAQRPWVLEVVPYKFQPDMADWSGADHPYVLSMDEALCRWTLYSEEGKKILTMNPTGEMFSWLWGEIESKNHEPRTKSKPKSSKTGSGTSKTGAVRRGRSSSRNA